MIIPDFSLEARSKNTDTLEAFYQLMRAECTAIRRERGVKFKFDRRVLSEPATMEPKIRDYLSNVCEERGVPFEVIPSGAGHDASLFANAGGASGILLVCSQNGSHNPHEAMGDRRFYVGRSGFSRRPLPNYLRANNE